MGGAADADAGLANHVRDTSALTHQATHDERLPIV